MLKSLLRGVASRKSHQAQLVSTLKVDDFCLIWRRSRRRRRSLAMKVDKSGQLLVMTPMQTSERELRKFVQSRRQWIATQLDRFEQAEATKAKTLGREYWFMGVQCQVLTRIGPKNNIVETQNGLEVTSRQILDRNKLDRRVKKWLRVQADQRLVERLAIVSRRIGLRGSDCQIKGYTARWGSCGQNGLIQLNWKLIMLPIEVIDYVIVHELCHLRHFNHSAEFWGLVKHHCEHYQQHRRWLKQNGQFLV